MSEETTHAEMIWDELQEAKKEIKQLNDTIDMLKKAQINYQMDNKAPRASNRVIDRIMSINYNDHVQQALNEAGSLFSITEEGSPLYHGLQSIAQSSIAIAMLLEDIHTVITKEENS